MNKIIGHPSEFIVREITDSIRHFSLEAEQQRTLHAEQLTIIYKQHWLKMFVPKEYGGLGLSLPEGVRIEECLSWADGSVGWVITLCSGAGWFTGFLNEKLMKVFADDRACVAGSGAPTGTARMVDGGYEISGHWKYASGSLLATVFTANCIIMKEGKPLLNEAGGPLVQAFLFNKDEVKVSRTWSSMGMIATGSHEFDVNKLRVKADRCFIIDAKHAVLKEPLYQYPFLQLAEATLTANLSGMAMRFLDLCEPLFEERLKRKNYTGEQKNLVKQKLAEAKSTMAKLRQSFYDSLEASWDICAAEKPMPASVLNDVSHSSHALARASRLLADELYPYCGLIAANSEAEINRVWRNLHTATQHDLFTFS